MLVLWSHSDFFIILFFWSYLYSYVGTVILHFDLIFFSLILLILLELWSYHLVPVIVLSVIFLSWFCDFTLSFISLILLFVLWSYNICDLTVIGVVILLLLCFCFLPYLAVTLAAVISLSVILLSWYCDLSLSVILLSWYFGLTLSVILLSWYCDPVNKRSC